MPETPPSTEAEKLYENVVTIWSKVVDTQMHFNEMSAKSRQLGLTFVAAALGLAVFLLSRADAKYEFDMVLHGHTVKLHVAEFVILAAAVAVYAVKLLDLDVYHKMLRGSVAFGEDLEETHLKRMLGLNKGMTQAISHFSRYSDASLSNSDGKQIYCGSKKMTASRKISGFYWVIIIALLTLAIIMFVILNDLL